MYALSIVLWAGWHHLTFFNCRRVEGREMRERGAFNKTVNIKQRMKLSDLKGYCRFLYLKEML